MENNELSSGLNTTIETKTQVCNIILIHKDYRMIVNDSFKMYLKLVLINY